MSWKQENSLNTNTSPEELRKFREEYSKLHLFSAPTPYLSLLIKRLNLQPHIEGGLFVETDRDLRRIPNPFLSLDQHAGNADHEAATRSASTSIFYLLTPTHSKQGEPPSSVGRFHRNKGRTVHTLHRGRGRYKLIHGDEVEGEWSPGGLGGSVNEEKRRSPRARIESFVVGRDVEKGEVMQWVVEGGKWKSSFLLPDEDGVESGGLLISETVVPGFEYSDHDFLTEKKLRELVSPDQAAELTWLIRQK